MTLESICRMQSGASSAQSGCLTQTTSGSGEQDMLLISRQSPLGEISYIYLESPHTNLEVSLSCICIKEYILMLIWQDKFLSHGSWSCKMKSREYSRRKDSWRHIHGSKVLHGQVVHILVHSPLFWAHHIQHGALPGCRVPDWGEIWHLENHHSLLHVSSWR